MIKELFTEIASIYDRMNHLFSLGRDVRWRRLAVERVESSPRRILDIASGTGDFAFALANRFPEAEVVGLDLTPAMLEIASRKNSSAKIAFMEGDATALPFSEKSPFELVSCAFGFRNIPDKRRALAEARRVLADGGELLVLEFFRPASRFLGAFITFWLKVFTLIFVRSRSAAYGYLRQSVKLTLSEGEFVELARTEGFKLGARDFFFPCCTCLKFKV